MTAVPLLRVTQVNSANIDPIKRRGSGDGEPSALNGAAAGETTASATGAHGSPSFEPSVEENRCSLSLPLCIKVFLASRSSLMTSFTQTKYTCSFPPSETHYTSP